MALLDSLSLEEGKRALQIDDADIVDHEVLAVYISATSQLLDREAGPVVQRTVTAERHDGGRPKIFLRQRPVATVTTVTEYQGTSPVTLTAEAAGTTPANSYLADFYEPDPSLFSGTLLRRSGGWNYRWWPGGQNIVVTYTAGRYATTAAVAERFKRAAAITLENLWRDRGPSVNDDGEYVIPFASFPGFALPNAAAQLLAGEVGLDSPWGYR